MVEGGWTHHRIFDIVYGRAEQGADEERGAIAGKGDPSYLVEGAAITALGKLGSSEINRESKEKPILKLLKSILQPTFHTLKFHKDHLAALFP